MSKNFGCQVNVPGKVTPREGGWGFADTLAETAADGRCERRGESATLVKIADLPQGSAPSAPLGAASKRRTASRHTRTGWRINRNHMGTLRLSAKAGEASIREESQKPEAADFYVWRKMLFAFAKFLLRYESRIGYVRYNRCLYVI